MFAHGWPAWACPDTIQLPHPQISTKQSDIIGRQTALHACDIDSLSDVRVPCSPRAVPVQ
eukprot:3168293-Karenia_brevis.AAC.1